MGEDWKLPSWMDLVLTIVMALAAVGTAWSGFQSAKWSGYQAISFAEAGAARTESAKAATDAGQDRLKDLVAYTSWIGALQEEIIAGTSPRPNGDYAPDPDEVSGFLYERFRPEFKPAVDAWIATHPLVDPAAPATPFDMPEYALESEALAADLVAKAEAATAEAQADNQRSDNYVFMAVVLALALFFAGVAGRMRTRRSQWILSGAAVVTFLGAAIVILALPKTF
ncbi:hypothetical protein SAMN05216298_3151 [Glycomyces sambucus]|uniref:Uncharacterized protein n=1 Tax=Glycomyces sambucus TaxID=380244 RepID=A0A1G9IC34_9ACTN|nr:hypothetical protein [Glycomyces sambucus]SDL22686.1 hypothetical protein SAMN05216298_3151 [Glycomyces sambucus]